jgi:hypothetical protein
MYVSSKGARDIVNDDDDDAGRVRNRDSNLNLGEAGGSRGLERQVSRVTRTDGWLSLKAWWNEGTKERDIVARTSKSFV